jgi:secreted trypsin-like serine protease
VNDTSGPDVTIDVTPFVQNWTHNTNFGFVLYGAEENLNAFTENSCKTWYTNASSLDVTHY